MVVQDDGFPAEIWAMILENCDTQTLCIIRLVSRVSHDIATEILFKTLVVRHVTRQALERLVEFAVRPHISRALRNIVYRPYIRTHSEGSNSYRADQDRILVLNLLGLALSRVLDAAVNTTFLKLQYPANTRRSFCNGGPVRIPGSVFQHICSNPLARLSTFSAQELELEDIPEIPGHSSDEGGESTPLSSVECLDLGFRPIDLPFGRNPAPVRDSQWLNCSHRLPQLIGHMPNLRKLSVTFNHMDDRMRSAGWDAVRCTRLESFKLVNLQISQTSLLSLLYPSIDTLRHIKLKRIVLFDGTWAAVYEALLSFEAVTDTSDIWGKGYLAGHGRYSENDAANYRKLFDTVEARRASAGLSSMRDPTVKDGVVVLRNFGIMERPS